MAVQLADATLHIFAICAAILTFKLLFMVTLIGVLRRIRGAYISPEDYRFRGRRPGAPDELVERVRVPTRTTSRTSRSSSRWVSSSP